MGVAQSITNLEAVETSLQIPHPLEMPHALEAQSTDMRRIQRERALDQFA